MNTGSKKWQKLFWFCFGIFAASAFCMKWMENDFWAGKEKFTIIGLEMGYSKEKTMLILAGLDDKVLTILRYHLSFDFAFMAGVYPGIAALCMMGRNKTARKGWKQLLFILALMQTIAWACDITENCFLFRWTNHPAIGNEFVAYHIIVYAKWLLALLGAIAGIAFAIKRNKREGNKGNSSI